MKILITILFYFNFSIAFAQTVSEVWVVDNGNGTYKNPVLHADYSEPDAIRVGDDYYMISSSFTHIPGLPILHSKDLVNWKLLGHALIKQPLYDVYDKVQYGAGVWAPSIRYHNNEFYIYYSDPDYEIYLINCVFAANMREPAIYCVPTSNLIRWWQRAYYYNCHREAGNDFSCYNNNLPNGIKAEDITINCGFGNRWNPQTK